MVKHGLMRGATIVLLLAGLALLSASRDASPDTGPIQFSVADGNAGEPAIAAEPLLRKLNGPILDIPLPFGETVHCFAAGQEHVLIVHRHITLFILPGSPRVTSHRETALAEACE